MSRTVGAVAIATGVAAVMSPTAVFRLWPSRRDAAYRMLQGWGMATVGLGLCLLKVPPRRAVCWVTIFSIPWDIDYGGKMGIAAAALNIGCTALLLAD